MASILNIANCDINTQTGLGPCSLEPSVIAYAIAVPRGYKIPTAGSPFESAETFRAFVKAQFTKDNYAERWHLTPLLTNFEDQTKDANTEERNGVDYTAFRPAQMWRFLMNGGMCGYKTWGELADLKKNWDYFFLDVNGNFIGVKTDSPDEANVESMKGFSMAEVALPYYKSATTSQLNQYMIMFKFLDGNQLAKNNYIIAAEIYGVDINQPQGVALTLTTSLGVAPFGVSGKINCAGDLFTTYGQSLAQIGAWRLYNKSTAAVVTISAVTINESTSSYEIAFATGVSDGDTVEIALAYPDDLFTATGLYLASDKVTSIYTI